MPAPATVDDFLGLVRKSGLAEPERLEAVVEQLRSSGTLPEQPKALAALLVRHGLLTYFYAEQMLRGVWRGFTIGKYQILERLGSGGMGIVYLGEHKLMGHRVAIKVLPVALAEHRWFLDRFYQEAQAAGGLNHPNIVHAHDIDRDGNLHFLVMEFVDGSSLQEIVSKHGPLSILRAPHYIRQAAMGLEHIHEAGLVHRDIKPANLLLDRQGVIRVLDLGLVRCFKEQPPETLPGKSKRKTMVGTDDYLAPEQIVNSDDVDIRADIYGLGATFYFMLTGTPPFDDAGQPYLKLIRHLAQSPKPIRTLRAEVPPDLAALVEKMMAKNPWERFQTPAAVVEALTAWTKEPIPPPPEAEMPQLSPAARRPKLARSASLPTASPSSGSSSSVWHNRTDGSTAGSGLLPGSSGAQTPTTGSSVFPRPSEVAKEPEAVIVGQPKDQGPGVRAQ
jgi:serine/threonine protein kinase